LNFSFSRANHFDGLRQGRALHAVDGYDNIPHLYGRCGQQGRIRHVWGKLLHLEDLAHPGGGLAQVQSDPQRPLLHRRGDHDAAGAPLLRVQRIGAGRVGWRTGRRGRRRARGTVRRLHRRCGRKLLLLNMHLGRQPSSPSSSSPCCCELHLGRPRGLRSEGVALRVVHQLRRRPPAASNSIPAAAPTVVAVPSTC
jgi:hypothetical protein